MAFNEDDDHLTPRKRDEKIIAEARLMMSPTSEEGRRSMSPPPSPHRALGMYGLSPPNIMPCTVIYRPGLIDLTH